LGAAQHFAADRIDLPLPSSFFTAIIVIVVGIVSLTLFAAAGLVGEGPISRRQELPQSAE
jgi:hypothetical protein